MMRLHLEPWFVNSHVVYDCFFYMAAAALSHPKAMTICKQQRIINGKNIMVHMILIGWNNAMIQCKTCVQTYKSLAVSCLQLYQHGESRNYRVGCHNQTGGARFLHTTFSEQQVKKRRSKFGRKVKRYPNIVMLLCRVLFTHSVVHQNVMNCLVHTETKGAQPLCCACEYMTNRSK